MTSGGGGAQKPARPSLGSLVSALLLYALLAGLGRAMVVVLPLLAQLYRDYPRLAILGGLGAWVSPMIVVALVHHVAHRGLDRLDVAGRRRGRGLLPGASSFWAGLFAWAVLFIATSVSTFVVLVAFPPDPPDDSLVSALLAGLAAGPGTGAALGVLNTVSWLAIAAGCYELRRRVEKKIAAGDPDA